MTCLAQFRSLGAATAHSFKAMAFGSVLFLMLPGCGGDGSVDGRVPVEGTASLDGTPIKRGTIELHPKSADGTLTGGTILDGKFVIPAAQGAKPGKYQVRIFASEDKATETLEAAPGDSSAQPVAKERVAAKFNTKSELETDIAATGNKDLKFEVTSK